MKINIFDKLFPRRCLICRKNGGSLCSSCADLLPKGFAPTPSCVCLLSYESKKVRRLLHRLKYRSDTSIYDALYNRHVRLLKNSFSQNNDSYIFVSIPMRSDAKKTRRLDHVAYIAKKLATGSGGIYIQVLKWRNDKGNQVGKKNRQERLESIRNTMIATESEIKGGIVIIVDDIYTTGATISEARRALQEAGAKKIFATVLAH